MGLDTVEAYAKGFNLSYTVPRYDRLKNKIVISGYIFDKNNQGLDAVKIYWGNNRLLTQTNETAPLRLL
jgi:hypothetical protein